jgi:hypothetical protein
VVAIEELVLRLYYNANLPRDYPFNVTFTNNTKTYFTNPITELVLNRGANKDITLPTATDADSDAMFYADMSFKRKLNALPIVSKPTLYLYRQLATLMMLQEKSTMMLEILEVQQYDSRILIMM